MKFLPTVAVLPLLLLTASARVGAPRFLISFPASRSAQPLDGRLLVIVSVDSTSEPRFQVSDAASTAQIFGIDVDAWKPGTEAAIDATVLGYPLPSLSSVKPGRYRVQALINRYDPRGVFRNSFIDAYIFG